jgi:uncharacterized membrane protein YsdA (DUF1294 family)
MAIRLRNDKPLKSKGLSLLAVLFLTCFLILPSIALARSDLNPRWVFGYAVAISAFTFWTYAIDKRRAIDQVWRTPENTLHLFELLGGWPGAYLAQRKRRHKCSKASYQFVFWLIVLAYQYAAIDSLLNWRPYPRGRPFCKRTPTKNSKSLSPANPPPKPTASSAKKPITPLWIPPSPNPNAKPGKNDQLIALTKNDPPVHLVHKVHCRTTTSRAKFYE